MDFSKIIKNHQISTLLPNKIDCTKFSLYLYVAVALIGSVAATVIIQYYDYIRNGTALLASISTYFCIYYSFRLRSKNCDFNKLKFSILDIITILFMVYVLIRYFTSRIFQIGLEEILLFGTSFIGYFFIRQKIADYSERDKLKIVYIVIFFGLAQSVYALCQSLQLIPNVFPFLMGGTYGNPGDLANVLIIAYALSLGMLLMERRANRKVLLAIITMVIATAIILSKARTAWIAIIIITLYFSYNWIRKKYTLITTKIPKTVFYIIFIVLLGGGFLAGKKLYTMKKGSADGRIFIWSQCFELITEKPIFGHGYDSFMTVYSLKQAEYFKNNFSDIDNAHLADDILFAYNEFIHFGIEYGLIGTLLLIAIFVSAVWSKKTIKSNNHESTYIIRAAIIGIIVSSLFSYPLQNASILVILFIIIALVSSNFESKEYSFSISAQVQMALKYLRLVVCMFLVALSVFYIHYNIQWKKLYQNPKYSKQEMLSKYNSLSRVLKYDKAFLYNYGAVLHESKEYEKAIMHFNKYLINTVKSNVYIIIGDSYFNLERYEEAEKYLLLAMYSKPILFLPKQKLLQLYKKTEQNNKAYEMATIIMNTKVKVMSTYVKEVKNQAHRYLLYGPE